MIFDTEAERHVTGRLVNWGIWNYVNAWPDLDYPAFVEIMKGYFPQVSIYMTPNDADAFYIANFLSTLNLGTRKGRIKWGRVYELVCKMEFVDFGRPRQAKREIIEAKLKIPCSERSYKRHLHNAKRAIHFMAEPIQH